MEEKNFKALPLKKKIGYVLKKYHWHLILQAWFVFLMGTWVWENVIHEPPTLSVDMIDVCMDSADQEAFQPALGGKARTAEKANVEIRKCLQFDDPELKTQCDPGILLFCDIMAAKTDIYFWKPDTEESIHLFRDLMDLRELLPMEVLEANRDKLFYTKPLLEGGVPCAVRLENNSWVQENKYYDDCMVGVAKNTKNADEAREVLCYLLTQ